METSKNGPDKTANDSETADDTSVKSENKNQAILLPIEQIITSQNKSNVILAFSLLKRQNNHLVIQKATELHVLFWKMILKK